MKTLLHSLKKNPPDLLILVDYPGFNLRLAKKAKSMGIKTFYYIAPKLWASRQSRIKTIKKNIDKMAVIFPFEVKYFKKLNFKVSFVGNPLSKTVKPDLSKEEAYKKFKINSENKIVGLFPGSRKSEIKKLLPVILKSAKKLQNQIKNIQFALPIASSVSKDEITFYLKKYKTENVRIIENSNRYNALQLCDVAIAVSGTITLEIALMKIPMLIIYKVSPIFYLIIKCFIKIPYIGLCNIIAEKKIVQEFIQTKAQPSNLNKEIKKIFENNNYRKNMICEMEKIKTKLTAKSSNLTETIIETLENQKTVERSNH